DFAVQVFEQPVQRVDAGLFPQDSFVHLPVGQVVLQAKRGNAVLYCPEALVVGAVAQQRGSRRQQQEQHALDIALPFAGMSVGGMSIASIISVVSPHGNVPSSSGCREEHRPADRPAASATLFEVRHWSRSTTLSRHTAPAEFCFGISRPRGSAGRARGRRRSAIGWSHRSTRRSSSVAYRPSTLERKLCTFD